MGYRADYFKTHDGINGKHRCARCGRWIEKEDSNIDHIIPKKYSKYLGKKIMDSKFNTQLMCEHCNKSKGAKMDNTATDLMVNVVRVMANDAIRSILGKDKGKKRRK